MFERNNVDAQKFWAEREKEKGGKVRFFTFATLIGKSHDAAVNLGGLLYIIDNTVIFEDFEKDNWIYKIMNRKRSYEKTEFDLKVDDIAEIKLVSKNAALNCISGILPDTATKPLGGLTLLFTQKVFQLRLKSGYSLFFEIMNAKEFEESIKS
ncbi:MAG: hypothetical protein JXQ30_12245 [Spirochaetes bacterium]|nr:hypothetical protein [Spirochaetota bacterium]